MQQCLSLLSPASEIAARAILFQLRDMSPHRFPAFYLTLVVGAAATGIISAEPLEPTARIFRVNPSLLLPKREWL